MFPSAAIPPDFLKSIAHFAARIERHRRIMSAGSPAKERAPNARGRIAHARRPLHNSSVFLWDDAGSAVVDYGCAGVALAVSALAVSAQPFLWPPEVDASDEC